MFEENYDKFANIILSMIDMNLENQLNLDPKIRASMPKEHYAEQFATVRFDIGRRTGKSRFVQEYLKNADGGAMSVVHCPEMLHTYKNIDHGYLPHSVKNFIYGKLKYRFIFVDEPKLVFEKITEYDLYSNLVTNELQCFIFIGN